MPYNLSFVFKPLRERKIVFSGCQIKLEQTHWFTYTQSEFSEYEILYGLYVPDSPKYNMHYYEILNQIPPFPDLIYSTLLLSHFVLQNFKFTLAIWSRNFKENQIFEDNDTAQQSNKSSWRSIRYLYVQTKKDFPWAWQSTLPAFHINSLLFLLSFVSVPLCLPFFKYILISHAFTPVVLMSWISYLTFISVSQVSIWESIIFLCCVPKAYTT